MNGNFLDLLLIGLGIIITLPIIFLKRYYRIIYLLLLIVVTFIYLYFRVINKNYQYTRYCMLVFIGINIINLAKMIKERGAE